MAGIIKDDGFAMRDFFFRIFKCLVKDLSKMKRVSISMFLSLCE